MKIPRDISSDKLISALKKMGYVVTRQKGSHIRISTQDGEHHETIPKHNPIKVKTLHSILKSIANHHHLTIEELLRVIDL
jgi:predicted RNA binding protein YcfA (HicA-like mRNA interferase family)